MGEHSSFSNMPLFVVGMRDVPNKLTSNAVRVTVKT